MQKFKKALKIAGLSLVLPTLVFAQGLIPPEKPAGVPGVQGDTITGLILYLIDLTLAVAGVVAVAFLIIGGFRYITSAGNEESAESAKKIILNSIIGLVVIILSYGIIVVIINALRGQV